MEKHQKIFDNKPEAVAMAKRSRHPAERFLSTLSIILSIGVFILLAWSVTYNMKTPASESAAASALADFLEIDEESAAVVVKSGAWSVLIIFLFIYCRYLLALKSEVNRAASEDVTCDDLVSDEARGIQERYAEILGMHTVPALYFSDHGEHVTVFDVVTYGKKFMVLSTFLNLEKAEDERMINLRFRLATKMGNIYMGYNNILFQLLTLPGRVIPILRGMYIKSLIYSSDRMAMEILNKDTAVPISRDEIATSLFLRGFSDMTYPLIDTQKAIRNREERFNQISRLEKAILRIKSVEPLIIDRMHAVKDTSTHGAVV